LRVLQIYFIIFAAGNIVQAKQSQARLGYAECSRDYANQTVMVDKRTLEFILSDQQEELEERGKESLCRRTEETLVDLTSPQAQVVIGVRRSGKSTLCYQALHAVGVKSRLC